MKKNFKATISALIPKKIKSLLVNNIDCYNHLENDFARITYSQQGEDLEIERLFPQLNDGFYIDVGAFHPFKYSNTYKLYKKGWRGINIEPNPDQLNLFAIHRKEDINLNIGISSRQTVLNYYSFNNPAVNTFVESNASEWSQVKDFNITSKKEIPTEPLKDILKKYLPPHKKINLMNVDVEGMDMEVLQSNDWVKFRPYAVLVEDAWYARQSLQDSEVYQFMLANEYSLWNIIGITMFFTDNRQSPVQNN